MTKRKNFILLIGIITIVFISIYILNHYSVYSSDDYSILYEYKAVNLIGDVNRIDSLTDILKSMKNLYLNVNGRIAFHFILQCILAFPKVIYNILNSIIFILLGIIIYKTVFKDKLIENFKLWALISIYCLIYLIIPSFGMTILWCSGSLNYMWSVFFIILYFNYLIKLLNTDKIKKISYIIIFILAFMTTNTVENFSLATVFFSTIVLAINIIKNKKIKLWQIITIISMILGLTVLFTGAPNSSRGLLDNFLSAENIFYTTLSLYRMFGIWFYVIIGSYILLFVNYIINKSSDRNIFYFLLTGIFSIAPLYASPYIDDRMFFLCYITLIITVIFLINNLLKIKLIKNIISIILVIITTYVYITICYKDVKKSFDEWIKIETIILNNKRNNILDISIPNYKKDYSKYTIFNNPYTYMTEDVNGWMNKWIAHHYKVNTIKVVK